MNQPGKLIIIFLLALNGLLSAQTGEEGINTLSSRGELELLPYNRIWCLSWNPAANDIYDTIEYHLVETSYLGEKKLLKYSTEPGRRGEFSILTSGVKRIGRLVLNGEFRYNYNNYNDLVYNGTLRFNPLYAYTVGDSISGKQSLEEFNLKGSVTFIKSEKLSIGLYTRYRSGVGAKNIDPRNLTKLMEFEAGPGVLFHGKRFSLGLATNWLTTNSELSYSVVGDQDKHILFEQLGLGFADDKEEIQSAGYGYFGKGINSSLQVGYAGIRSTGLIQGDVKYFKEEFRTSGSFRELLNELSIIEFDFHGKYIFRRDRNMWSAGANANIASISGDEYTMKTRTVIITENDRYPEWYIESMTLDNYLVVKYSGDFNFSYIRLNQSGLPSITALAGVKGGYQKSKVTPVESNGFYSATGLEPYLESSLLLLSNGIRVRPSAGFSYRTLLASDYSLNNSNDHIDGFFENDLRVISAEYLTARFGLEVEKPVNIKSIKCIYLDANFSVLSEINSENDPLSNRFFSVSTGFLF